MCIGVPAKRGQNGLPTAQQAEKKRKVERVYLGSAGQSEARYREKGVNWGTWVSGSARQGGGHEGWWQGESRAPWAMLVEGNGGISKASSQTQSWKKKKGKFRKVQATLVSI